jgi:hypothetical protein
MDELVSLVPGGDELEGTILSFSDSGTKLNAYAVVEVVRRLSLVVPVEDLRTVAGNRESERKDECQ